MDVSFFDDFKDPYLGTDEGKGVFLAGVTLGMLALWQVPKGAPIDTSPMYKQLRFGKLQRRNLALFLSRVPELARVSLDEGSGNASGMLESLCAKSGEFMLKGGNSELGVDGNFAFSVAFLNARDYFFGRIFRKKSGDPSAAEDMNKSPEGGVA